MTTRKLAVYRDNMRELASAPLSDSDVLACRFNFAFIVNLGARLCLCHFFSVWTSYLSRVYTFKAALRNI